MNNEHYDIQKTHYDEITPAQDFMSRHAIVTVGQITRGEKALEKTSLLVRSDGRSFRLDGKNADLLDENLYTDRFPQPSRHWSAASLEQFLTATSDSSVSFAQVFQDLKEAAQHYIDLEDQRVYTLLASWVIGTYFHRMFSSFPYLHFNGNKACGKTKTLQYLCHTTFNSEMSANNTPAYLIRVVHHNSSTLLLDEVESLNKSKDEDSRTIINILNAGYKKGAFVGKAEQAGKNQTWTPRKFDAYSPKAFAGIQGLDPTLASRCIPIIMVNSSNTELLNREINDADPRWQKIRDELYLLLLKQFKPLRDTYNQITDTVLVGREWELWKPLLSTAKNVSDDVYTELRELALEIQIQKQENNIEDTDTPKVLMALEDLLVVKTQDTFCTFPEIINKLVEHDEESYGWLKESSRRPSRWVSQQLKRAGIVKGRAQGKRIFGVMSKGYEIDVRIVQKRLATFRNSGFLVSSDDSTLAATQNIHATKTKPYTDEVVSVQPGNQETHFIH